MKKEDWQRIAKWIGLVYTPIVLLIIGVFLLAEYRAKLVEKDAGSTPATASMTP